MKIFEVKYFHNYVFLIDEQQHVQKVYHWAFIFVW